MSHPILTEIDSILDKIGAKFEPEKTVRIAENGPIAEEISFSEGIPDEQSEVIEDDYSDLQLTPIDVAPKIKSLSPEERLDALREKILEASLHDDPTQHKILLAEMQDIANRAVAQTRAEKSISVFESELGKSYDRVFESKEWEDFNKQKRWGKTVQDLYSEASANDDYDTMREIFRDFKKHVRSEGKRQPPVTMPSKNAAPTQPTRKPNASVEVVTRKYLDAIKDLRSGKMSYKDFKPLEDAYRATL